MSFRPPSIRSSRPRSPVNRSTPIGREVFVLLGVAVSMLVFLVAVNNSALMRTVRMITGFESAEDSDLALHSAARRSRPAICVHAGVDNSLSPAQQQRLRSLGIVSVRDRLALMCHLGVSALSVTVDAASTQEVESMFPQRICCADLDVFFAKDATPVVGRPERLAELLASTSTAAGTAKSTDAWYESLLRAEVSLLEIRSADPTGAEASLLSGIVDVVGQAISHQIATAAPGESAAMARHRSTRVTLELKLTDLPAFVGNQHDAEDVAMADPTRAHRDSEVFSLRAAVQSVAHTLSNSPGVQSRSYALWEHFGVIVDPLRMPTSWRFLMMPLEAAQGSRVPMGPEGFAALATQPQLWYALPIRDLVLDTLSQREAGGPIGSAQLVPLSLTQNKEVLLTASKYCSYLLQPPRWARAVMPSLGALRRCTKWFDVELNPTPTGPSLQGRDAAAAGDVVRPHLVPRRRTSTGLAGGATPNGAGKPSANGWFRAAHIPNRTTKEVISWIVDNVDDYERVIDFGRVYGLASQFVVSNVAQQLLREVMHRF